MTHEEIEAEYRRRWGRLPDFGIGNDKYRSFVMSGNPVCSICSFTWVSHHGWICPPDQKYRSFIEWFEAEGRYIPKPADEGL